MMSWVRTFLAASTLALALAGCGVKGSLETPQAAPEATAEAQSGQGKPQGGKCDCSTHGRSSSLTSVHWPDCNPRYWVE